MRAVAAAVVVLLLATAFLVGRIAWNSVRVDSACSKVDDLSEKLADIVDRGKLGLRLYYREGTLTLSQYRRAVAETNSTAADLRHSDCA